MYPAPRKAIVRPHKNSTNFSAIRYNSHSRSCYKILMSKWIIAFLLPLTIAPALAEPITPLDLDPGAVASKSWAAGPLMEMMEDGIVAKPRPGNPITMIVGFPAIQDFTVQKVRNPSDPGRITYRISGITVSTNAGGPRPGCAIYIRINEDAWNLRAISNRKGEFDFDEITRSDSDRSVTLYLSDYPVGAPRPAPGVSLRQYPLEKFAR